jgi:sugar-specific transcriptional regulator TrmB
MDPKKALEEFGCSEKEIKVYLALLQIGSATAHQISQQTGILRQSVYDVINGLKEKGLVLSTLENSKSVFAAQDPKYMLAILEEKKATVVSSLPAFEKLHKIDDGLITQQYKGLQGIKMLYDEFFETSVIYTIQPDFPEEVLKTFFFRNFMVKRLEKKITLKVIRRAILTDFQREVVTNPKKFREVRLCKELDSFSNHVVLYGKSLAFIDYDTLVAVKITHPGFIQSQKIIFDLLWKMSKEV